MPITEKIAQNTLLQAVARVAMAITLPLLLMGAGYVSAMGSTVAGHTTDITLLKQRQDDVEKWQAAAEKREDAAQSRASDLLNAIQNLTIKAAETGKDVGYLRDWVEEQKRTARP